jgi:hypothetical protein
MPWRWIGARHQGPDVLRIPEHFGFVRSKTGVDRFFFSPCQKLSKTEILSARLLQGGGDAQEQLRRQRF